MRTPIIAANWKMNTTVEEAISLVISLREGLERLSGVEKVLCPPFVSLWAVAAQLRGTSIQLGAQNMHFEERGAYTGEVSPLMLAPMCQYVILGHSERRQHFGEDDATINRKVARALQVGLKPILCVGEPASGGEENKAGRTQEVVERQVRGCLEGIQEPKGLVIAYEPVWAIGTGRPATGEQANATIGFIRHVLARLWREDLAQATRVQYGGSVTGANIAEFIAQPEIDGALVGGASLKAEEFLSIVRQTQAIKNPR